MRRMRPDSQFLGYRVAQGSKSTARSLPGVGQGGSACTWEAARDHSLYVQTSLSDRTGMFTCRNSLSGPPPRIALGPKFFCTEEKCRPWNGLSSIVPWQTQEDGFPLAL